MVKSHNYGYTIPIYCNNKKYSHDLKYVAGLDGYCSRQAGPTPYPGEPTPYTGMMTPLFTTSPGKDTRAHPVVGDTGDPSLRT